ncbi:unnamed protein product [Heligmosomoides polygyrus]|uniref:Secreted protein n=1 Tax=Heligmosomoides polygyrus TaxID=6339 RepID=A0A183GFK7_HELPZ|nr:unnamed protein product [Heligmosomoides polygyrus]
MWKPKISLIYCFLFITMSFPPAKVVSILLAEFAVSDDNDAPTREETKIARRFAAILCEGAAASVDVETDEDLGSDVSTHDVSDWDHCDDEDEENSNTSQEKVIRFDTNIPAGATSLIQSPTFFSLAR